MTLYPCCNFDPKLLEKIGETKLKSFLSIVTALIIFAGQSFSQEETLLGSGEISNGGFGGPVVKYVQIKGEPGVLVGGRGGWIINHSLILGGGGYGLVNDIKSGNPPYYDGGNLYNTYLNFGYGGAELEYIFQSDELLHFSVYTLIGGGSISYRNRLFNEDNDGGWDSPKDDFFIVEPAINAELNVVSFMRIDAGLSYRFVAGVNYDNLKNSDFAGPSAILTFKFGNF